MPFGLFAIQLPYGSDDAALPSLMLTLVRRLIGAALDARETALGKCERARGRSLENRGIDGELAGAVRTGQGQFFACFALVHAEAQSQEAIRHVRWFVAE